MNRVEMDFLNESRNCTFREDTSQIDVAGTKFGPFKKGVTEHLPNWVIENLLKHELVDIETKDHYEASKRLRNLKDEAKKNPYKLQQFPPLLYTAITRKSLRLQSDKTSIDPRTYEDIENLRKMTYFLVETRLSKILRVANSNAYQETRKLMTQEERWLCEELVELISGWRQNIMD